MSFVQSSLCERLWAASEEAKRPVPRLSDDDVLDFMVVEAMTVKIRRVRKEERDKAEAADKRKAMAKKLAGLRPGDPVPD